MTRRGEVRRSVARGQSGLVLGEVETLEWATRIGFEARLANTRLRIFWVTEDAQHPGALPALEAKCSEGGRVGDRDGRNRRQ